jgi:hypothetical protein
MKVFAADGSELMEVWKVEFQGNDLVLHGKIMGSLPMKAVLRPEQARRGIKILGWKALLALPFFPFRKATKRT